MKTSRRRFLASGSALAAAAVTRVTPPAFASDPVRRVGGPRLKLGLAAYSLRDYLTGKVEPAMTMLDFVEQAARWQVDGVEPTSYYFPEEITPEYLGRLKRLCYVLGLGIIGVPIRNTFTFPAGPDRDREVAHVKTWIERAGVLGAPTMRIFAGDLQPGQSLAEAQKNCVESIEACAEHAARRGVLLGLENHPGPVSELDSVLAIVKEVRSDFVGINLDTGYLSPDDPYGDFERRLPWAVTVQIKTEVRAQGEEKRPADLARIVESLKKTGFRGYATLEYEAAEPPLTAVPRELERLRALL
jgi:sugar phosphate isomerase/epimerase